MRRGAETGSCTVIVVMDSKKLSTDTVRILEGETVTTVLGKETRSNEVCITQICVHI